MANKILSPSTLWSDFDDTLELNVEEEMISEEKNERFFNVRFLGRETEAGRVRIYAQLSLPAEKSKYPALLILPDADQTICPELMRRFTSRGFAVLMPDYRGDFEGCDNFTEYPEDISYANYSQAGRHICFADETAKETSWYEWVAVARYCVRYLKSREDIDRIGVLGLKRGGDVAWQLMATSSELACGVSVCAGGWMTYKGKNKFGEGAEIKLDDERYRFLGAVDSQAYAPYVKCPVLMLNSTNDSNFDADRAFDTYARINPEMEKTFHFATRYDGRIGNTSLANLDLFTDKFLKNRAVFIPSPVEIAIEEDNDGELIARLTMDSNGEFTECKVFMAEDNLDSASRNWMDCAMKREEGDEAVFRLNAYENAKIVFAFAKAKYSCGFYVSSKIAVKRIEKKYTNQQPVCRILYSSLNNTDSFIFDRTDNLFLADCIADDEQPIVRLVEGAHGIQGVYSPLGLKTFKLSDSMFRPADNSFLKFDIYAPEPCEIEITVNVLKDEGTEAFICKIKTGGGNIWYNHMLYAKDFKNTVQKSLTRLNEGASLSFNSSDFFALNNLLWI